MKPIKTLVVLFLVYSTAIIQAYDEVDESDFENGTSEYADNRDSESPAVNINRVSIQGNGCRPGEASAIVSPDGKAVSVLFDNFSIQGSDPEVRRRTLKNCRTSISINVPDNYQAAIIKSDYRGYNYLPKGSRAKLVSIYHFTSEGREQSRKIYKRKKIFHGPIDSNFYLTSNTNMRRKWSRCGKDFTLDIDTRLVVKAPRDLQDELFSGIDSLDINSNQHVKYHLTWKRCKPKRQRR